MKSPYGLIRLFLAIHSAISFRSRLAERQKRSVARRSASQRVTSRRIAHHVSRHVNRVGLVACR